MHINYQINQSECGICVIQSLIQHFHHKSVDRSILLNEANLDKNGLSIYDFEIISQKYGINIDSYEISFEEFKQLKTNSFFVLILNNNGNLHYVIARKHHNQLIILCSQNGEYTLNYDELEKVWTGIYIEIKKDHLNKKIKFNELNTSYINWKLLLITNLVQIFVLLLTLFNSTFFEQLFNKVIADKELANLLSLILIFSLTFLCRYLGETFINFFTYKNTFDQYHFLHQKMLQKISNKYLSFYEKVDANIVRNIDQYIFNIAQFYNMYLNTFISDVIIIFAISIFILTINWIFFILLLTNILLISVIELVNYFYYKKQINVIQEATNRYDNLWNRFIFKISISNYWSHQTNALFQLKNENQKIRHIFFKNFNFNAISTFFSFLNQYLFFMAVIIISCKLIVNDNLFAFPKLTVITSLLQLAKSSSKSLISIVNKYNLLKYSQTIYNNFLTVDNKPINVGIIDVETPKEITYNDLKIKSDILISGPSGCGKTTMLKKLNRMIKLDEQDDIKIDNIDFSSFGQSFFDKNMIYLNNQSELNSNDELINIIQNSVYAKQAIDVLNKLCIKDISKCSLGQKQALVFISLLQYKNKIICLDELLANVDRDFKKILLSEIKPLIARDNFLLYVSHDQNINNFFNNRLTFYEQEN